MPQSALIPPMLLERRSGREADELALDVLSEDERIQLCASALNHLNEVAIFQRLNGGKPDGVGSDADLKRAAVIFDQSAAFYAEGLTREALERAVEKDALSREAAARDNARLDIAKGEAPENAPDNRFRD